MLRLAALAFTIVALPAAAADRQLTADEIGIVREVVGATLKDPANATFSPIRAAEEPDGDVLVCGAFNARNGYGGYIGFRPFHGVFESLYADGSSRFRLIAIASENHESRNVEALCRAIGIPFD